MKKRKILTLLLIPLILTSCSKNNGQLKILCPTGGPAIAFYKYGENSNFETTTNPQTSLIPMFQTDIYDVIVAPTNGGLAQIVKFNAQYKIAATITFGNFYIISTGRDGNNVMDEGDKVLIFQEADLPGKVFNYLYSDLKLDVTAVGNASNTKNVIENNGVLVGETTIAFDYIMTAEPIMTVTKKTPFINIQDEFFNKTGGKMLTQASIFVKNSSSKNSIDNFLVSLENDINNGVSDPDLIYNEIAKLGSNEAQSGVFGTNATIAKKITQNGNGFSLGFKRSMEIKDDIQQFVDLFPGLNLGVLDEKVFYQ